MSGNRCRHSFRYRCSKKDCQQYFRLPRLKEKYIGAPGCPSCGAKTIYRVDARRKRELEKQDTCYCNNYPFPHRSGTLSGCVNYAGEMTEDDIQAWKRTILTDRTF